MMAAESIYPGVSLDHLLAGFTDVSGLPPVAVSGIASSSELVVSGDLFLAVAGARTHGLHFAHQALAQGAVAVIWDATSEPELRNLAKSLSVPCIELTGLGRKAGLIADRFYGHASAAMHCIGITGTDGKTSVSHFIAQALSTSQQPCGLFGTLGYGSYGDLHTPTHTTPDALRLQAEIASLRDRGIKQMVMEVSSHALHQHRTEGVAFNTAVLTHLSRDHLDYHGSVEAYAEAKRRLFETAELKCAVLNVSDNFGRQLGKALQSHLRVIACYVDRRESPSEYDEWLALKHITPLANGIEIQLDSSWGEARLKVALPGAFNAENILVALGALLAAGLPFDKAIKNLSAVSTVPGRMELFAVSGRPRVVVDYAHTAHALQSVLQSLRPHCKGELVCVFGAGGDRDPGKRPQMGAAAEHGADRILITNDNPRSEDPQEIMRQIVAGFEQPQRAICIEDRAEAIESAITTAAVDDWILVAGKGHEQVQYLGSDSLPFSDRLLVEQCLRRAG